ncbi:MAG: hypothetical protein OEX12_15855, partial [Gammaproteobacteria bacterium]|nr:hypothetical protein [Gammaproteobacteria bacterium]
MTALFNPAYFQFDLIDSLYFISGLFIFLLGLVVSFRERGTSVGRVYFLFTVSIAAWVINSSILMATQDERIANLMVILSNIPVTFIPAIIFHYTRILLDEHHKQRFQIQIIWFASFIFSLLQIINLDFASAFAFEFGYYSLYGLTGYLFLVYFTVTIAWTYYTFIRNVLRMEHNKESHPRFRLISIALICSLLATTDFFPTLGIDIQPTGVIFVLFLFIITVYVTWRYRLVDITAEYITNNLLHIIRSPLIIFDLNGNIKLRNNIATELFKQKHLTILRDIIFSQLSERAMQVSLTKGQLFKELNIELDDYTHTYEVSIS